MPCQGKFTVDSAQQPQNGEIEFKDLARQSGKVDCHFFFFFIGWESPLVAKRALKGV